MKKRHIFRLSLLSLLGVWGCGAFEDPTPSDIFFELRGPVGTQVQVVYATQFIASIDDLGVTGVTVFASDTVLHTMPIDTTFTIAIARQWFVQVSALPGDPLSVDVIIDVDNRNLVSESGLILPGSPWNFVYMFNRALTRSVEVII
jgi:hypothetical protein